MTTTPRPIDWVKAVGNPDRARLHRWRNLAHQVLSAAKDLRSAGDDELHRRSRDFRWRVQTGMPLRRVLPAAYALVSEAARRAIGLEYYPVQIMGGIALFDEGIAEMQTGEGKTLTAVLPAYLRALRGEGCHVVTVNDYLARRDAQAMGPIFELLGISVGCIQTGMEDDQRRSEYAKDITYGTAKEMGFDFLRDRLKCGVGLTASEYRSLGTPAQNEQMRVLRGLHFALVDEADSVLIDDARTPLIIGLNQPNEPAEVALFRWSDRVAEGFARDHEFVIESKRRMLSLTEAGCRRVVLTAKPVLIGSIDSERLYGHVELALMARHMFARDRDYVVQDDEVAIVDESTGRIMEGRKWQDGLHHAIEAKERIPISAATATAARITMQSFFRRYAHLAGMTGTAQQARREIRRTYRLHVTVIPTHRPCIRRGLPARIFATMEAKQAATVAEIKNLLATGRSILVGTPSVSASEALSARLTTAEVAHRTLNARHDEEEAEIVSHAGDAGRVTIATNMAGRGTDIKPCEELRRAGGLHVIATEMHSARRIDRQLVGRTARQGDPGSFQFFLSFEDELLSCLGEKVLAEARRALAPNANGELSTNLLPIFKRAQRSLERLHRKQRRELLRQEKRQNEMYLRIGLDPYLELNT